MDFSDKLYQALNAANLPIRESINWHSNKFQRFSLEGRPRSKKDTFIILFPGGASFGDWRNASSWKTIFEKDLKDYSKADKIQQIKIKTSIEDERAIIQKRAIDRAKLLLNYSEEASLEHPYIKSKKIIPYYSRQIRSCVIVKIKDIQGNLLSLQIIKPNGFKRFLKNTSPKNGMVFLTEPLPRNYDGPIYICEGYATGCSIYETMGPPVICAMSAGNLLNVAMLLRSHYQHAHLHICADNDAHTKENPGVKVGKECVKSTGACLHYPVFINTDLAKPTDYNDLMQLAGIDEVYAQLIISRPIIQGGNLK